MTSRYHIAASYVDVNDTSRGLLAASLCVVSSSISPQPSPAPRYNQQRSYQYHWTVSRCLNTHIMRIMQYAQSKSLAETNLSECWTDRLSPSASHYHPQASEPTSSINTKSNSFDVDTQKRTVYHHHRPATTHTLNGLAEKHCEHQRCWKDDIPHLR
jgi:hypothetical protein